MLKVIYLYYHANEGSTPFYAAHIRVRSERGMQFLNVTFTTYMSLKSDHRIGVYDCRVIDCCFIGNKYSGAEVANALNAFFEERQTNIVSYMKRMD